jgi:hypothetical protein
MSLNLNGQWSDHTTLIKGGPSDESVHISGIWAGLILYLCNYFIAGSFGTAIWEGATFKALNTVHLKYICFPKEFHSQTQLFSFIFSYSQPSFSFYIYSKIPNINIIIYHQNKTYYLAISSNIFTNRNTLTQKHSLSISYNKSIFFEKITV